MSTPYQVNITMSQATVTALQSGGFNLYGFKAVKTTAGGGVPLVWFQTTTFGLTTSVTWTEQYQAYTTDDDAIANGQVTATNAYDIDLGQTLDVNNPTGVGVVNTLSGTANAISILNTTNTQFTCGISQMQGNAATPLCAFPLYGNMLDIIAPIEQVILMFATTTVNTGSVIYKALSQGVLLDLTSEQTTDCTFDINNGWAWGGGPNGQTIQAEANLVPLLIQSAGPSSVLVRDHLNADRQAPRRFA